MHDVLDAARHFLRGACWGGPPSMLYGRNTNEKYDVRLNQVKEANINNLRIFCWHPPEIPLFYRLCDEAGITVWQDFSLSHYLYPRNRETIEKIFDESIDVVKQIRNNPSVIFLSGGEEILYTKSDDDSDFFLQLITDLGKAVAPYHSIQWVPTCPLSWPNVQGVFKPRESIHAHGPHYGAGSVMLEDYYSRLEYAFIPELAITSCPSAESIRKFIPPDELWPPGPSWGYHWADLDTFRALNEQLFGDDPRLRDRVRKDRVHKTLAGHAIEGLDAGADGHDFEPIVPAAGEMTLLGKVIEHASTEDIFVTPRHQETADYIEGRYG